MEKIKRERGHKPTEQRILEKLDEIVDFINKKYPELPKGTKLKIWNESQHDSNSA